MDIGIDQRAEFAPRSLYGIFGENLDSNCSNGAGKTSFITAIAAGIFGPSVLDNNNKDLKNRHLDVPPRIIVELIIDGKIFTIDRTIGGKLLIKKETGDWITGKTDDVQALINQELRLTPKQLFSLTLKQQGSYGGFLLMKDSEKKDYLASFMNLEKLENSYDKVAKDLKSLENESLVRKGKIESQEAVIRTEVEYKDSIANALASKVRTFDDTRLKVTGKLEFLGSSIENLKNQIDSLEQDLEVIMTRKDLTHAQELYSALEVQSIIEAKPLLEESSILTNQISGEVPVPQELLTRRDQIKTESKWIQSKVDAHYRLNLEKANLEKELLKHKTSHASTINAACESCGQVLTQERIKEHLDQVNLKIDKTNAFIADIDQKIVELEVSDLERQQLENEREQEENSAKIQEFKTANSKTVLQDRLTFIHTQLQSIKLKLTGAKKDVEIRESALKLTLSTKQSKIKAEIDRLTAERLEIVRFLESEEKALEQLKKSLEDSEKEIASKGAILDALSKEQKESDRKQEVLNYVHMALSKNGFVGHIFDGILDELNNQINRNLQLVPLTSCFQLHFNSDKIAKTTGNVSKTITYLLTDEGKEIAFGTLSGAEKLIVIGSVEEAIADVLSSRLGIQIGWKFLDEQFAWIDSQNKELVLDFYRQKSQDRTYFIVDHASELNAGLENRITIIKQNKIASITQ